MANSELFFKSGSDINLTCVSLQAANPPSYIYWYKDGYLINYSQRGGINVLTERQTRTSTLVISRAVPPDSGNYTCFPSNSSKYIYTQHITIYSIYYCTDINVSISTKLYYITFYVFVQMYIYMYLNNYFVFVSIN